MKPVIASSTVIRNVDPYHAALVNKSRSGSMLLAGQTLFILETQPAVYAVLAANEAEKASRVTLVDIRPFGAFGRLYLAGEEADVVVGSDAAVTRARRRFRTKLTPIPETSNHAGRTQNGRRTRNG